MKQHKDQPEGVQVAIEILQNIPLPMLDQYHSTIKLNPEKDPQLIWNEIVDVWYKKRS